MTITEWAKRAHLGHGALGLNVPQEEALQSSALDPLLQGRHHRGAGTWQWHVRGSLDFLGTACIPQHAHFSTRPDLLFWLASSLDLLLTVLVTGQRYHGVTYEVGPIIMQMRQQ